ncbi:MAG: ECF-type sigma factor [Pseudomonadota bacterium]
MESASTLAERPALLKIDPARCPGIGQVALIGCKSVRISGMTLDKVGGDVDYTEIATAWQHGDREAGDELFKAIGTELRAIAAARLRQERHSSLSTGDLVNEAIIKLFRLNVMEFQGRAHILALASRLMRQILIDEARKRNRDKHSHQAITLTTDVAQWEVPLDLLSIEFLLEELAHIDEQRAKLVEMRFFGGMTNAEIAEVLEISEPTVKRRWAATRAWLKLRLDKM